MVMQAQITEIRLPNGKTIALADWTDRPLYSTNDLLSGFTDQQIEAFTYVVSDRVSGSSNISTRRTATEADTNISTPAGMSSSEEMLVYGIKCEVIQMRTAASTSSASSDATFAFAGGNGDIFSYYPAPEAQHLARLARRTILQLIISQKVYAQETPAYFSTGFGSYGSMQSGGPSVVAGSQRSLANYGFPSADASRAFAIPHHIGGSEKYRTVLLNPTGAAVLFFLSDGNPTVNPLTTSTPDVNLLLQLRIHLEGLYKRPVG